MLLLDLSSSAYTHGKCFHSCCSGSVVDVTGYIKLCPEVGGGGGLRWVFSSVEAACEEGSGCGLITRLAVRADQAGSSGL